MGEDCRNPGEEPDGGEIFDKAIDEAASKQRQAEPLVVAEVHLHIGNSGATFSVIDQGFGPTVRVTSSAFGNIDLRHDTATDRAGLQALRDMLDKALAFEDYTRTYVHAALPRNEADYGGDEAQGGGEAQGGDYMGSYDPTP